MDKELEQHLRDRVAELRELRTSTSSAYEAFKQRIDAATEKLLKKAGVWDQYQTLQDQLEQEHKRLQRQADMMGARAAELEKLLQWVPPEPPEPVPDDGGGEEEEKDAEVVYLGDLDETTALLVENKNEQTLAYLRETNTIVVDDDGNPIDDWWIIDDEDLLVEEVDQSV